MIGAWESYRLRLKRRGLLLRALRRRGELTRVTKRKPAIRPGAILAFATIRNEAARLPHFLAHYRRLGVDHFLIVDNASDDGGADLLADQLDVPLWRTAASYRTARFGMDWLNWLLLRYGAGHWCLTVDADELLVYPDCDSRPLPALTAWLDRQGHAALAALMLDLYPRGPLSQADAGPAAAPGGDPADSLGWFDAEGYVWQRQPRYRNISIRGGVRERVFFADRPEHGPHLHKTPLVRWRRPYAYLSSTHILLPRRLNDGFDARQARPTGVLLHSKFLPVVIAKSAEEKRRREHFTHAERYDDYYDAIIADPALWSAQSQRYEDWRQLEGLELMRRGDWGERPVYAPSQPRYPAPADPETGPRDGGGAGRSSRR